jgi:putative DNA primase/helicase
MVWDERQWAHDHSAATQLLATETARAIHSEATEAVHRREQDEVSRWAIKSQQKDRLQAMLWAAQPHLAVAPEVFDSDPLLLNVNNGTIDLRTGEIRSHDRADLITKLAPVTFDPDATCPQWEAFLLEIMGGDVETVAFLQRALGYTLTGDIGEQCMFVLYGTGANGKSTLIEVVRHILGQYCRPTEFRTLVARPHSEAIRNDVAALFGLRMVSAVESNRGQRFDEALVKQLTGGDTITARFLYAELFDFVPTFKIWLAVNHKPTITGVDDGIWRRVRLIPFDVKIPPQRYVKNLAAKLVNEEGSGILAWMVRGALAWREKGLLAPQKVRQATAAYRRESDELGDFIADKCVKGEQLYVPAGDLRRRFEVWCDQSGVEPMQKQWFASAMRERGFEPDTKWVNRQQTRIWLGLAFKPEGKGPF